MWFIVWWVGGFWSSNPSLDKLIKKNLKGSLYLDKLMPIRVLIDTIECDKLIIWNLDLVRGWIVAKVIRDSYEAK